MNDVVMRFKHVHAFTLMRLCLFTWAKDHIMNDDGDYEEKRMSFYNIKRNKQVEFFHTLQWTFKWIKIKSF